MTTDADPVKIRFSLERDADGWPPVSSEGVWAVPLGGGLYRVDNTPWFARRLACVDVVKELAGSDGVVWATRLVEWSGHLTVRVIPRRAGPLAGELQPVIDAFAPLGVSAESAQPAYQMIGLDVPPGAPLLEVKNLLREGHEDGRWDYDEGCVSDEWLAL
jgi:hypothetical protein